MAAKIDQALCTGCKKCYDLCPMDVFTWDEETKKPAVAYPEECWFCGICWMECPRRAINIEYPAALW